MKIKTRVIECLDGTFIYHTPIQVIAADVKRPKFDITEKGQCVIYADEDSVRWKNTLRNHFFRAVDEFFNPLPKGVYIRCVISEYDYHLVASGDHRGSINHSTGEEEGGLSVALRPEIPTNFAYYVWGERVGTGTDGEPLLDIATAKPISELMTYEDLSADYKEKLKTKLEELGISAEEYKAIKSGGRLKF